MNLLARQRIAAVRGHGFDKCVGVEVHVTFVGGFPIGQFSGGTYLVGICKVDEWLFGGGIHCSPNVGKFCSSLDKSTLEDSSMISSGCKPTLAGMDTTSREKQLKYEQKNGGQHKRVGQKSGARTIGRGKKRAGRKERRQKICEWKTTTAMRYKFVIKYAYLFG